MHPAIELSGIRKSFGSFVALADAGLSVAAGEVHALFGENGAGKSSLMNVAAGLYAPDAGTIRIDGAEMRFSGPGEAVSRGVGMIHQHFKLVKRFSVAENVLLANPRGAFRQGKAAIEREIREHAQALGFEIDPGRRVDTLSVSERQRVEIIKVLVGGARILILDEPTAVLTDGETERLFKTVREVAARGTAVVLVTHKLRDVKGLAHRVTLMRAGRTVATLDPSRATIEELTVLTVGAHEVAVSPQTASAGEECLVVEGLSCQDGDGHTVLADAAFAVKAGEIYGIAGVGGNGQTELAEALTGVRTATAGGIRLRPRGSATVHDVTRLPPRQRHELGFASVPADRQTQALASTLSVIDNFVVGRVAEGRYGSWARMDRQAMRRDTEAAIREFDVQGVRSPTQRAALLSGGNAQKLVLAREFGRDQSVLVAHSPSRGLDVRACVAVHRRLLDARDRGVAVVLISEDLDEVLSLSDRIGVMTRGRIVAEFIRPADRQAVGRAMVDHA